MSSISKEEQLYFLISISKGRLSPNATYEQAINYWYHKPQYRDIYDAVVRIAFTTLARTVRGISRNPNREILKAEASNYLENRLKYLSASTADEFDKWHRETSENLIAIFNQYDQAFAVGQAQKWINMSLKHLSIADKATVTVFYNYCHVPIDSYILKAMQSDIVSKEIRAIDAGFEQGKDGIATWSKIESYDTYLKFQKDFRENCGEAPLDYEFHLWQKQKDQLSL